MNLDPPWLTIARAELGELEVSGASSNPRILEYHATCTLKATSDEIPWCSAFLNWTMLKAGITGTNSAAALSWVAWGVRLTLPIVGAIGVLDHGKGRGHVGFIVGRTANDELVTLGGNQGNAVRLSAYPRVKFSSFRWPALPVMESPGTSGTG